jgi:hypothetical protein
MNQDEKLDILLDRTLTLLQIREELHVHIAKDEAVWKDVESNELDIKELVKDNSKIKTKHAALVATIATALSGGIHVALKALL